MFFSNYVGKYLKLKNAVLKRARGIGHAHELLAEDPELGCIFGKTIR